MSVQEVPRPWSEGWAGGTGEAAVGNSGRKRVVAAMGSQDQAQGE